MAQRHASTFACLFDEWDTLRGFKGFDPDEFSSFEACCAAERDYDDRLQACETALLALTPTSQAEAACLLEVISVSEGLTPSMFASLRRIQGWMTSLSATDIQALTPSAAQRSHASIDLRAAERP